MVSNSFSQVLGVEGSVAIPTAPVGVETTGGPLTVSLTANRWERPACMKVVGGCVHHCTFYLLTCYLVSTLMARIVDEVLI